ncbi:uncharacterized protein LOC124286423 [Haliotis rubra]|uniref:uncharacterized protein LOC124286423 n=1 Tax=Haliotis rubra TaxID=36100 RepID=UPI001EE618CD|nr:uncharacterized protein LOC124286423 [Haliotis rubra]XP_046578755.1 uncharacterized protein LOC124286423 [Haliotis rubra]XP_046578756.1 uncharacterized protein LOC124286423 [Haliotis rubra]XP_046578757.1 uncharacterized protein LOC124286423 [Haliotis rubra]
MHSKMASLVNPVSVCVILWALLCGVREGQCQNRTTLTQGEGTPASPNVGYALVSDMCKLELEDKQFHSYVKTMEKKMAVLFKISLRTTNTTKENDKLYNDVSMNYKPFLWYKTKTRHGRTLLMLSFHYDVLSMSILTIGVEEMEINITDSPQGCLRNMSVDARLTAIRQLLIEERQSSNEDRYSTAHRDYVCNQEIKKGDDDYAEFVFQCCHRDSHGKIQCSDQEDDPWISILYISVTAVKVLVFCFCPMFLPANMYNAMYVAAEYVVKLKKEVKKFIYVSEESDYKIKYKQRLTLEDISDWWRFRDMLETMPKNEILPIKMSEVRITVKGKRIIPENDPPTGLLRTFYDNLCRCKIKAIDPFLDCCDLSVYASLESKFSHKLTWHQFVQALVKGLMLLLLPMPYYIRLFIYYKFEKHEMDHRYEALRNLHLNLRYVFYKTNVIQHYSPSHGIFIAAYFFYFLAGFVIGFSSPVVRDKLKSVSRGALQDMNAISQTGVLQVIIRIGLWPFKKCGLIALLVGPMYMCITSPFCIVILVLYCIPTVYLSFRIVYQTKRQIGDNSFMDEEEKAKRRKFRKIHNIGRHLSKMDKVVHRSTPEAEDNCCPSSTGFNGFSTIKTACLQVLCAVFCLCVLYAIALIFAESFGLIVEVLAFTMMGIIVNASSTLKYVSMVLLVFVYMHDCYSNVYQNYLEFNKTIIAEMIDRAEDLKKIASLPSSMQENAAFQLKCSSEVPEIKTDLNFTKKEIRWKLGQLLLFLDSFDTPRIPLRLFQRLCDVQIHGAPGPVYLNLLRATGKFLVIVVFLLFVMIVVMAFGNVTQMSSTNQTLATLAGGFVPMLLKNVLSSKSIKLNLKTISFKGQIDEIIGEYKQFWPVKDLVIERDLPKEEEEVEGDKDGEKDGGAEKEKDKEKNGKDRKDENSNKEKDKTPEKKVEKKMSAADIHSSIKSNDSIEPSLINVGDDIITSPFLHIPEDQEVDLFIDLSSADAPGGWSYRGSSESIQADSMMPAYFPTNIDTDITKMTITYPEDNPV